MGDGERSGGEFDNEVDNEVGNEFDNEVGNEVAAGRLRLDVVRLLTMVAIAIFIASAVGAFLISIANEFEFSDFRNQLTQGLRVFANAINGLVLLAATVATATIGRSSTSNAQAPPQGLRTLGILSAVLAVGALTSSFLALTEESFSTRVQVGFTFAQQVPVLILAAASFNVAWLAGGDEFWKGIARRSPASPPPSFDDDAPTA